ncbi:DUF3037 domain-containing protein [Mangrovimonas sp. YM274]|uniref:DUF3037 domain-containing protein n=1 Tax=Mangrovimonas sp. YM274 TaxID=3070660 RepID=UPI0027DB6093|nr:DUF3037 domain-containing protein [Mangrovimonas sp. YM274]WMI67329.1 DUF3037 domain-containing protein [Mangrovimonas sp. YM274]
MPEKILYEYAVIRYVPKVEREEFINVGIVLYAKQHNSIHLHYHVDQARIAAFSPEADIEALNAHLESFKRIAAGDKTCGLIAQMDTASRFRWLTAVRSSVIQTSRPHPGFSTNLEATAKKLFEEVVL